jgi:hypothetical protein
VWAASVAGKQQHGSQVDVVALRTWGNLTYAVPLLLTENVILDTDIDLQAPSLFSLATTKSPIYEDVVGQVAVEKEVPMELRTFAGAA